MEFNFKSIETFGEGQQNLTFSQNMDPELLKIISRNSTQKNFQNEKFDEQFLKYKYNREVPQKSATSYTESSNQKSLKQDDFQESTMSFDFELHKRLLELENKKREILNKSPEVQKQKQKILQKQVNEFIQIQDFDDIKQNPSEIQKKQDDYNVYSNNPFNGKKEVHLDFHSLSRKLDFNDDLEDCYSNIEDNTNDPISPQEIIQDKEALEFLIKYFTINQKNIQQDIKIRYFSECLITEFEDLFHNITNEERRDFHVQIQEMFTTNNNQVLSLNALQLQTRELGLYRKIMQILQEIQFNSKKKKQEQINDKIIEEFQAVRSMLEDKKKDLMEMEKNLNEKEKKLNDREKNAKVLLKAEFEEIMQSLEEISKEKLNVLNKKVLNQERNLQNKLKIVEQKLKEIKTYSQQVSSKDDKLKTKVTSQDKLLEGYKQKINILEKKNQDLSQEIITLTNKNETQKARICITDTKLLQAEGKIYQLEIKLKDKEQESQLKNEESSMKIEFDTSPIKNQDEEIMDQTLNDLKDVFKADFSMAKKKKKKINTTLDKDKCGDEEVKILLNIVNNMLKCLKSTLPAIFNPEQNTFGNINRSISMYENQQQILDIGEFFYPIYNSLICNFVDICPYIMSRPQNSRDLLSLVELFQKVLNFAFRFQIPNQKNKGYLTDLIIEHSQTTAKSCQDHVLEVMNSSKTQGELVFNPITIQWKKKLKPASKGQFKQQSQLSINMQRQRPQQAYFSLFQNEEIQKELTNIFSSYLDSTEIQIKKAPQPSSSSSFTIPNQKAPNIGLDKQKHVLMTRININLLLIILSYQEKEIAKALYNINIDINQDGSDILNSYLKKYLVSIKGIPLIIWRIHESRSELDVVQAGVDLLLNLSGNGVHYNDFINEISAKEHIQQIFGVLEQNKKQNNVFEKLAVIIQRISYHSDEFQKRINQKNVQLLIDKMKEVENNEEDFLFSNLQAIISNIQQDN